MRAMRWLAAGALFLMAAGRALSGDDREAKSAADYWPFKVGSTWTLLTTIQDKKIDQVVTVTKVSTMNGKTRAELNYESAGNSIQTEIYETDAKSMARIASGAKGANTIAPPFPVVEFPLTSGKTWDWKGEISVGGVAYKGSSHDTASGPETIKTAAGTFQAMRVHVELEISAGTQAMTMQNDYWFAPKVGMVKQKATIGGQVIEGVLTSYKLAK